MQTIPQQWYGNETVQHNIFSWIVGREVCWEIPQYFYTEWAARKPAVIKNWLRVPEYHSIHASPMRDGHYDYVLDIDVPKLGLARKIEMALLEVFSDYKLCPTLITFTSNRGFHNWFFQEMFFLFQLDWGKYTVTTFELFYKVATHYLRDLVAEKLKIERNPFQKWIEVKTAKSMVRVPFCFHLSTKGIEIPIEINQILEIEKKDAQINNIPEPAPLKLHIREEVGEKWMNAVGDYYVQHKEEMDKLYRKPDFVKVQGLGFYAGSDVFPPCISTQPQQGNRKKCAGFIANFLYYCGWDEEKINDYMQKWFKMVDQKGITKDGHKFYWNQVKNIITHLNKDKMFLPGCEWLRDNNLCREDNICQRMKKKHPRFYILEKQIRVAETTTPNETSMLRFCATMIDDEPIVDVRFLDEKDINIRFLNSID